MSDSLDRVISLLGGSPTAVARSLGGSVKRQNVEYWLRVGRVPAEDCPAIERATSGAVRCEDLRPDVDWAVLRAAPTVAVDTSAVIPTVDAAREVA